jgi:hypothetical protein
VPSSGFSDWPAQQKNHEKKGRPLKFFFHRSKIQAGISDDNHQTNACARPRLLTLHHSLLSRRQLTGTCGCGPVTRYRADQGRFRVAIIIRTRYQFVIWNCERISTGDLFFRGFLFRGPIRESGAWSSAAGVHPLLCWQSWRSPDRALSDACGLSVPRPPDCRPAGPLGSIREKGATVSSSSNAWTPGSRHNG